MTSDLNDSKKGFFRHRLRASNISIPFQGIIISETFLGCFDNRNARIAWVPIIGNWVCTFTSEPFMKVGAFLDLFCPSITSFNRGVAEFASITDQPGAFTCI